MSVLSSCAVIQESGETEPVSGTEIAAAVTTDKTESSPVSYV